MPWRDLLGGVTSQEDTPRRGDILSGNYFIPLKTRGEVGGLGPHLFLPPLSEVPPPLPLSVTSSAPIWEALTSIWGFTFNVYGWDRRCCHLTTPGDLTSPLSRPGDRGCHRYLTEEETEASMSLSTMPTASLSVSLKSGH